MECNLGDFATLETTQKTFFRILLSLERCKFSRWHASQLREFFRESAGIILQQHK